MGLRRHGAFGKFLQQLPKGVRHSLRIILLSEEERFLLESGFALLRCRKLRQQRIQIRDRGVVILALLIGQRALSQRRRHLRTVRKRLHEIIERVDDAAVLPSAARNTSPVCRRPPRATSAKAARRAAPRKSAPRPRTSVLCKNVRPSAASPGRRVRASGFEVEEFVDLRQRGGIAVIEIDQPLVLRVFRFLPVRIFGDDLLVQLFRFLVVAELPLTVRRRSASFPRAPLPGSVSGCVYIPPAPCAY